ncbi:MAG: AEC family transporter [Ruminococcaceae bacterium]|nr:AEC family transporter [Oscillospiraceae bacterium]
MLLDCLCFEWYNIRRFLQANTKETNMLDNILTVGNNVLVLFVLIGLGFVCNKIKLISEKTVKEMTNFVLYIVTPCVIINSYQREFDEKMLRGLLITLAASAFSYAITILLAHLLVRDKDKRKEKTLRFGTVFSNCGYMSLPLQQVLLGDIGVFYGTTYIMVFQIMLWTYGIVVMSGNMKNISLKKIIINPGVISSLIGVLFFACSIALPTFIGEPIKHLAALNTPIPMVIVGFHLANTSLKLKGFSPYVALVLRHIISPVILLLCLWACKTNVAITTACVIAASSPVAATTTMFSEKFDGDTPLSATVVSVSTLLAIIMMPFLVGLALG